MNYEQRQLELNAQFQLGVNTHIEETGIDIRFFPFKSQAFTGFEKNGVFNSDDRQIAENMEFDYPVFMPKGIKRTDKVILLIHGLNERFWNKYLCWAEYLCKNTGKPVILFPIAFHMNRSPLKWSNPRALKPVLDSRRNIYGEDRSLSFANVAFSERISENPIRFYSSGRQSMSDLSQLTAGIKEGVHPLFKEDTQIDIFSYSIGAFLSQITMMTNPSGLFSNSKLFMFCGGGIFSSMFGESRCIMDKQAFKRLFEYYMTDFAIEAKLKLVIDKGFESFYSMISPERNKEERESFFKKLGNRIGGISLSRDTVIPYHGVVEALGADTASMQIDLQDFSYSYTHENPFPTGSGISMNEVNQSFNHVFAKAANLLS
jgi:hypothetical protein